MTKVKIQRETTMNIKLSDNIRAFRKARSLTQQQLADALGVTVGAVYKWEANLSTPDLSLLVELADLFDTSVDVLLGYEIENNKQKAMVVRLKELMRDRDERALVGNSGSGKSTLLNLLMASHREYDGTIRFDSSELREISSHSLYGLVSMIEQNVFMFDASVRDNITMFRDFPAADVNRAIALSGLSQLIERHGADYLCGENGRDLSGGEKQRISIARSLLQNSSVLLADEVTAALDAQTAYQVTNDILKLSGITRIVVTHALVESLLRQYDSIIVLKDDRIVERGTFEDLMEQKGYFYALYTVAQ